MKKVYDVRYACSQCPNVPWFPVMIVAESHEQAREEAQAQCDSECDAEHTILNVKEDSYEPAH